ncbi:MAG: hypothetical protein GY851_15170 [bacterium]|nr:hypothetical protein [bacterium]
MTVHRILLGLLILVPRADAFERVHIVEEDGPIRLLSSDYSQLNEARLTYKWPNRERTSTAAMSVDGKVLYVGTCTEGWSEQRYPVQVVDANTLKLLAPLQSDVFPSPNRHCRIRRILPADERYLFVCGEAGDPDLAWVDSVTGHGRLLGLGTISRPQWLLLSSDRRELLVREMWDFHLVDTHNGRITRSYRVGDMITRPWPKCAGSMCGLDVDWEARVVSTLWYWRRDPDTPPVAQAYTLDLDSGKLSLLDSVEPWPVEERWPEDVWWGRTNQLTDLFVTLSGGGIGMTSPSVAETRLLTSLPGPLLGKLPVSISSVWVTEDFALMACCEGGEREVAREGAGEESFEPWGRVHFVDLEKMEVVRIIECESCPVAVLFK